jgi:hypothetical protein
MNRKLWLLNLLLLLGIGLIARELHSNWKAAREREQKALNRKVEPAKAPPPVSIPPPVTVQAAGYIDIAQQMLFSKDRNPTVVVEQKVEAPKPQPPLPKFFGVMDLGDGPLAILSEGAGRQKPFKVGDQVADYKLLAIGTDTLTFRWDEKDIVKKFSELQDRSGDPVVSDTRAAAPAAAAPPPPPPATPARAGPGADMGSGLAACVANDSSPAGTVVDGKRKVVSQSPFGSVCRWEPVK